MAARRYGENGAVVSLLTEHNGRRSGFFHGAFSSRNRGVLEIGNIVDANWRARIEESLGSLKLELRKNTAVGFMHDALKLLALQSACALCDSGVPEREGHSGLYHGFLALLEILESDVWAQAYVMWEIALLKEMGFSLDLTSCAVSGTTQNLAYVSPKTGRAVSLEAGEPYKDRLLKYPDFLKGGGGKAADMRGAGIGTDIGTGEAGEDDVLSGLIMTGYFLEYWAFAHHSHGVPEARRRLHLRFQESFEKKKGLKVGA